MMRVADKVISSRCDVGTKAIPRKGDVCRHLVALQGTARSEPGKPAGRAAEMAAHQAQCKILVSISLDSEGLGNGAVRS